MMPTQENSSQRDDESFEAEEPYDGVEERAEVDQLLIHIDGFEGPIDVLLELARNQKVDLAKISILQLVRQYLEFIDRAKERNLELAAEYLVMAAWLAYLKSRLFLPKEENSEEPTAEEVALALQFQLQRLEAMQKAAEKLFALPRLGQGIYARGEPEGLGVTTITRWNVTLYDMFRAYGNIERRKDNSQYDIPPLQLMSTDAAMERLSSMLGRLPQKGMNSVWATLESFMPDDIQDTLYGRSTMASTFTAGLELAKQGKLEMRQEGLFRPIYMRSRVHDDAHAEGEANAD